MAMLGKLGRAALLVLLAALVGGCGGKDAAGPGNAAGGTGAGGGPTVGVALASRNHNFFIGMEQGIRDELEAQGITAEFVVAEDSASTQQQQVDTLIRKGVKAIIMCPVDAEQAATAVKAANDANVPVFLIDRRVTAPGTRVTATIETNNTELGKAAAKHALQLLGERHQIDPEKPEELKKLKTTIVHLWGLQAASSAQDRAAGIEAVINQKNTPNVKVIEAFGDFNAKKAQEVIAPILAANPDVDLILCHNDDNAVGALNAVIDVKKDRGAPDNPKRILIVGVDGNKAAIEEIRKGNIEATVSQQPILMGKETVRQVKKVLDGSQPDKEYIETEFFLINRKEAEEKKGELWADQLR